MKLPHPIPYQGSKRNLADQILRFFPDNFDRLVEPFAGSAAMTIASAFYFKANRFVINDINEPLINLWENIIENPKLIIKHYHDIWHGQHGNEEEYYYQIRERFNDTRQPEYLLFLLAKCVKAAVRYNTQGQFNQSPDKRRLGRNPQMMRDDILRVSQLLKGKTECYSQDYQNILDIATDNDLVYMDPPYQGTGVNGGFNYSGNIEFDNFVVSLFDLNNRNVPFILSYDGRTGNKTYGNPLPDNLNLTKIEINAGRSSQATLLNRNEITYEALYLSPTLIDKIDLQKITGKQTTYQTELFAS
ncbi:DNA adenine methylase [Niabella ginsengisoli]|uniref:Site-specific DNA-methyltransferase (adenine-specific) n=1 Tax=Niabella ginsengisoli TaxID=522298 RepID=A0ABS9SJY0_9BACT|nr:DNA adenine methylase [Niabella ginsengisoli]MCH5598666.1 DNA adenine methylase [Niabella ginsengisoli]